MKIGVDFHGVMDTFPEVCKPMLIAARKEGALISVITGPPLDQAIRELRDAGYKSEIHYDRVISVVDWLKGKHFPMKQDDAGNWWTEDAYWWGSKAKICDEYRMNIMIDDSIQYEEYFEFSNTRFIRIEEPVE